MARKSRKCRELSAISQTADITPISRTGVPTALYARLSEENNGYESDDSITTQIKLVESYIAEQNELTLVGTFVDNGFTGTNFERPEFLRMMDCIRRGEIRCVVVKDLSRFGRNYLEAGYYIENIFPMLDCRLIAVNDNFDSSRLSDRNSLILPIKNLLNAMYAKDISKKQVAVGEMKRKLGIYEVSVAPYGYYSSRGEGRLVKAPEVAPYVDMVFRWTLAGVSRSDIAKRFNIMKVPTPLEFVQSQGQMLDRKNNGWNAHTVKGILINPTYAGVIAMGKTHLNLSKGIKGHDVKREDWTYHYDMHEPYVSREDYQKIEAGIKATAERRKKRMEENRESREEFHDCFRGMIVCGECGKPMPYALGGHDRLNKDLSFAFYRCISRKKVSRCENQRVQQNFLKMVVMDQIKNLIRLVCDRKDFLKRVQRDEVSNNTVRVTKREITEKRRKIQELDEKLTTLSADLMDGVLDREDYQFLRERMIGETQTLETEIFQMEQRLLEMEKAVARYVSSAEELEAFADCLEFDEELVKSLVQEIRIFNGNRVEIVFKCTDIFENALVDECMEGVELRSVSVVS